MFKEVIVTVIAFFRYQVGQRSLKLFTTEKNKLKKMSFFVENILKKRPCTLVSSVLGSSSWNTLLERRVTGKKVAFSMQLIKKNLFYCVTKGLPWSVCSSQLVACVQTNLPSGKIGEGAPSPFFPEGRRGGLYTGYPLVKGLRILGRNSWRNCINDAKGCKVFSGSWKFTSIIKSWI